MPWSNFVHLTDTLPCNLKIEQAAIEFEELNFNLGGGYRVTTPIGHPDGLRSYVIKATLSDNAGQTVTDEIGEITRAKWVWNLFKRCKAEGNKPVIIRCPIEDKDVLVQFAESKLTMEYITVRLWGTGIPLVQLRDGSITFDLVTAENPQQI